MAAADLGGHPAGGALPGRCRTAAAERANLGSMADRRFRTRSDPGRHRVLPRCRGHRGRRTRAHGAAPRSGHVRAARTGPGCTDDPAAGHAAAARPPTGGRGAAVPVTARPDARGNRHRAQRRRPAPAVPDPAVRADHPLGTGAPPAARPPLARRLPVHLGGGGPRSGTSSARHGGADRRRHRRGRRAQLPGPAAVLPRSAASPTSPAARCTGRRCASRRPAATSWTATAR